MAGGRETRVARGCTQGSPVAKLAGLAHATTAIATSDAHVGSAAISPPIANVPIPLGRFGN